MDGYDSVQDAVAAALARVDEQDDAKTREYIGLIYQDPETGRYLFTDPHGQGRRTRAKASIKIPPGSARAIYHNHPRVPGSPEERSFFSPDDIRMAAKLGIPSFIGVGSELFMWDPFNPGERTRSGLGNGQPVLAQIPIDAFVRRRAALEGLLGPAPQEPEMVAGLLSPSFGRRP